MSSPADDLLRHVLQRTEQTSAVSMNHPDEETLALFAAGGLTKSEHESLVNHLAQCPDCRIVVANLLIDSQEISSPRAHTANTLTHAGLIKENSPRRRMYAIATVAATLLIAVGLWLRNGPPGSDPQMQAQVYDRASALLAQGDFERAESVLAESQAKGTWSERLLNLKIQAIRRIPSTVALATMGRLTQFGIGIDGSFARGGGSQTGLKEAGELLQSADQPSIELLLNRGHWALAAGETAQALTDFEAVTKQQPDDKWGWQGLGLSQFLNHEHAAAEASFRMVINLDATNLSAKINLALTLQELDRRDEARVIWQALSQETLSDADRKLVTEALSLLEESNGETDP
ncbi:MAG: zf-HC2 domain-containing protein [Planctomycetaceae bacterium]